MTYSITLFSFDDPMGLSLFKDPCTLLFFSQYFLSESLCLCIMSHYGLCRLQRRKTQKLIQNSELQLQLDHWYVLCFLVLIKQVSISYSKMLTSLEVEQYLTRNYELATAISIIFPLFFIFYNRCQMVQLKEQLWILMWRALLKWQRLPKKLRLSKLELISNLQPKQVEDLGNLLSLLQCFITLCRSSGQQRPV